jgi:hypothetical protein
MFSQMRLLPACDTVVINRNQALLKNIGRRNEKQTWGMGLNAWSSCMDNFDRTFLPNISFRAQRRSHGWRGPNIVLGSAGTEIGGALNASFGPEQRETCAVPSRAHDRVLIANS